MEVEEQDPPSLHDLLNTTAESRHLSPPDLTSPTSADYLDHLVSLSLASLAKEPTLIAAEAATVEAELVNLCYREYNTFLSVHHCSSAVRSAFDDFQDSLDHLLGSVPALEEQCRTFTRNAHHLTASRNRSILVQEHQDKLLDLLELPQLMETCVRNGYYQEAMELAAHARDLHSRYPETRLVADVAKEVDSVVQLLLAQLLNLLREPVNLSTALKTVNYLRRLDVMDESSLGLAFLSGRLHNFRHQLLQIEKDRADPVRYVRKYIDFFREHVYDIISQYTAVFDDYNALISFAGQCVSDLVQLVSRYVPRMATDPASLSSVLIQLGYCSLSFARIGLDFAQLIVSPFSETMMTTYSGAISLASDKLVATLKAANKGQNTPTDAIVDPDQRPLLLAGSFAAISTNQLPSVSPFPPLGVFVNEHLSALNALRLLAPVHLAPKFIGLLSANLKDTTRIVLQFVRETEAMTNNDSRPARHSRTASSPRAHLLRRNTETQLSPSARSAKRKESQQICLIFALVWRQIIHYMLESLGTEVFGLSSGDDADLKDTIGELDSWIDQHHHLDTADTGHPNGGSRPNGEVAIETLQNPEDADPKAKPTQEMPKESAHAEEPPAPSILASSNGMSPIDAMGSAGETETGDAVDHAVRKESASYASYVARGDADVEDEKSPHEHPITSNSVAGDGGDGPAAEPEQECASHRELKETTGENISHQVSESNDAVAPAPISPTLDTSEQANEPSSALMEPMFADLPMDSDVENLVQSDGPAQSVVSAPISITDDRDALYDVDQLAGLPQPQADSDNVDQVKTATSTTAAEPENMDTVESIQEGTGQEDPKAGVQEARAVEEQEARAEEDEADDEQVESLVSSLAPEVQGGGQKKKKKKKKKKN